MLNVLTRTRLKGYEEYLLQVLNGQDLRNVQRVYAPDATEKESGGSLLIALESLAGKRREVLKTMAEGIRQREELSLIEEILQGAESAAVYEDRTNDAVTVIDAENEVQHIRRGETGFRRATQMPFYGGEKADNMQTISDYFRRGSRRYDGGYKRY